MMAQMLETTIINHINFSSLITTKAARIRQAAGSDLVAEFGLRRAQGLEAGLIASRAAYIGGVDITSNVLAGKEYDIPLTGTISHSWILSFASEQEAFTASADLMGDNTVLLVDTYQSKAGIQLAIETAKKMQQRGHHLKAIRLDSGDLCQLSQYARSQLDAADLSRVDVMASGNLDEYSIADLKQQGACINGWGVGTHLVTSYDQPALDIAYKLSSIYENNTWQHRMKISDTAAKKTLPGKLQTRRYLQQNKAHSDVIFNELDPIESDLPDDCDQAEDLLLPIIQSGEVVYEQPSLIDTKAYCERQQQLLSNAETFSVTLDKKLATLANA